MRGSTVLLDIALILSLILMLFDMHAALITITITMSLLP